MKNAFLVLLLLCVTITGNSQISYQYFKNEGFKTNCNFKLRVNTLFIQIATQQGTKNIIGAYVCYKNKENPAIGSIANINVYDLSNIYSNIPVNRYAYVENGFLKSYENNLKNAGIQYKYVNFKGVSAIEYTFKQMDLPTMAILFIKNKKNYLIQYATRNKLIVKYNDFKKSFDFY